MAYDIYGQPLRPGYCEAHPRTRGSYPCEECDADAYVYVEPPRMDPPDYSEEDICAGDGHPYYGDDCDLVYGGRCYCGERRYLKAIQPRPATEPERR